jgi:hypothetical protein
MDKEDHKPNQMTGRQYLGIRNHVLKEVYAKLAKLDSRLLTTPMRDKRDLYEWLEEQMRLSAA